MPLALAPIDDSFDCRLVNDYILGSASRYWGKTARCFVPVRDRIMWGGRNPFGDQRLADFPTLIREFRAGRAPRHWRHHDWENRWGDLPLKPPGYYHQYYVGTSEESGELRIVLGRSGEVYVSGNHHRDWRQVVGIPGT